MNISDINSLIPMVIETTGRGERAFDIFSLLLRNRLIFLGTPINDQVANITVAQLLFLNQEDREAPINMYINSPGGQVYAGLAIYDNKLVGRGTEVTGDVGIKFASTEPTAGCVLTANNVVTNFTTNITTGKGDESVVNNGTYRDGSDLGQVDIT